jgi:hypothetical protein
MTEKKRNSRAGNMFKPLHSKLKALTSKPKTMKKQMYNLLCVSVIFLDPLLSGSFGISVSLSLFLISTY